MRWRGLLVLASAWVLWTQTRTSGPAPGIKDAWNIVETFATRADCETARRVIDPQAEKREGGTPTFRTRFVCFPDTLDPQATP